MAKKRKHLKTDRRSVERRREHMRSKDQALNKERNELIKNYYFDKAVQAMLEGDAAKFRPSMRELKKARAEIIRETKRREKEQKEKLRTELVENGELPKVVSGRERKLKELKARGEKRKEMWIKAQQKSRNLEFQAWKYKHQLKDIHGHEWFDYGEIGHLKPTNYAERERDKKLWIALQEALNIEDALESEKQFHKIQDEIFSNINMTQEEKDELAKTPNLTFRALTSKNLDRESLNYLNYLEAAKIRNLYILVQAIEEGGPDFVHWLYYTKEFRWTEFYKNEGRDVGFDAADLTFRSLAKQEQNHPVWGELLTKVYNRYVSETPYR